MPNVDSLLEDARAAIEKRDLNAAEESCRAALAIHRRSDAFLLLGLIYVNSGRAAEALETYSDLLKIDPSNYEALEWLGTLYLQVGRTEDATNIALRALQLYPDRASSHSSLARCLFAQQNWQEAAHFYTNAVRLAPNVAGNHHFLGLALYHLGQKSPAERSLRRAVSLMPNSSPTLIELGRLLIDKKDYAEAIGLLRRAVAIAPTSPSLILLAKAYNLSEKFEDGMRALRKAIDINPKAKIAYEMLGDRLQDRGQFEAAIEAFNSALAIDDSSAAAYYGISRCRKLTPEDGPMIRRMEQLLQEPERTEDELRHLNYALAKAHDDLGHCELAMRFYDEANRLAKLQRPEQPERAGAVKWGESKLFRTFNPRLFEKYSHLGSQSERPIFIVGMIRSGTTLTEQIISSHRAVAGGGEIKFWMEDDSIRVLRAAMNGASFELQARKLIEKYDQILARLGAGQVRVTDKMPINYIALGLMHLLYPNAKIIHCRRNPIDTCLSIYMTPLGTGPAFAYDRRDIVDTYREYEMVMKHWREALPPGAMLEVKYEDLVDHSEEKIREIVSFLGLEWDEACLQHERNERNVMTPSRWQARQPVYKTSVEKWRRYERWLGVFAELAPES